MNGAVGRMAPAAAAAAAAHPHKGALESDCVQRHNKLHE